MKIVYQKCRIWSLKSVINVPKYSKSGKSLAKWIYFLPYEKANPVCIGMGWRVGYFLLVLYMKYMLLFAP